MLRNLQVDDTDDRADFLDTMQAMATMNMTDTEQSEVLQLVAGILHLGNIIFTEEGSEKAVVANDQRNDWFNCNCAYC